MRTPIRLLAALALMVPAVGFADTVRMKSGTLHEGEVGDLGDRIRVTSPAGELTLRWRDVDVVLTDTTRADLFREKLAETDRKDARALYELALWAERAGLHADRTRCLELAVEADPEHKASREALAQQEKDGAWLSGSKLLEAKGFVGYEGRWVLKEEAARLRRLAEVRPLGEGETRAGDLLRKAASDGARVRKLAETALEGMLPDDLRRPALKLLRRGEPAERRVAATVLARVDDVDVLRPLIHAAIMDRSEEVRGAAVVSLAATEDPDVVMPFARALWSKSAQVRMNAAEGMGGLGGPVAIEYLIRRLQSTGGRGIRNHLFVGTQRSYISDFDVEIAQAAQIGDPIVGTIREGIVLDAAVLGVVEQWTSIERRVIYGAVSRATGKDFGQDPVAWKEWWDGEEGRAVAAGK